MPRITGARNHRHDTPRKSGLAEFERLLEAAEGFLRNRDFTSARKFALEAQQSNPSHYVPPKIIVISIVLSAPPDDCYAVLDLPAFTKSQTLIRAHFEKFHSVLNPKQSSSFPFISEAYGLVLKAWTVLSDPDSKLGYDEKMRSGKDRYNSTGADGASTSNANSFWTICPYCYYVYEYLKMYEGCCLRCQNENCRKAFHGVPLGRSPPPEVVEKRQYVCNGFVAMGSGEDSGNGWSPFSLLGSSKSGDEEREAVEAVCIEISDDEMEYNGKTDVEENGDRGKNVERETVDEMEVKSGIKTEGKVGTGNDMKVGKEGEKIVGNVEEEQGSSRKKLVGTRIKKSVPRTSTKFMGKGVRVKRDVVMPMQSLEKESDENFGFAVGGGTGEPVRVGTEAAGLAFFEGEDDIFVGLQDIGAGTS